MKPFKITSGIALLALTATLFACGGGGSGGTPNSGIDWQATPSWPIAPTPPSPPVDKDNSVPITVDLSMISVNRPSVTIKLCPPNSSDASQCVTVNNMLLDTGSVGVRVANGALTDALRAQLLTQAGATDDTYGTAPIVQCALFASGYFWGPVKRADVVIGSKTASNIPVQVIDDNGYATPKDCVSRGGGDLATLLGTQDGHIFNGIVGIGHFVRDTTIAAKTLIPAAYYFCSSGSSCTPTRVALSKQVMNPVAAFATNNNGTIIKLPALPAGGQSTVTGELVFGVGTQSNNALPGNANILPVDSNGYFTTQYQGRVIVNSAIDSGTPAYAFNDLLMPVTSGWYTPADSQSRSAAVEATNGSTKPRTIPFVIDNALNVTASNYAAYNNIGTYLSSLPLYDPTTGTTTNLEGFLWGLPFFYGRSVYTVIEGAKVGTQTGPFVAF